MTLGMVLVILEVVMTLEVLSPGILFGQRRSFALLVRLLFIVLARFFRHCVLELNWLYSERKYGIREYGISCDAPSHQRGQMIERKGFVLVCSFLLSIR